MSAIEPDPCIPITDGKLGCPTNARHHGLFSGGDGSRVGVQCALWCRGAALGRYVWPRADLRPDGVRILKGWT